MASKKEMVTYGGAIVRLVERSDGRWHLRWRTGGRERTTTATSHEKALERARSLAKGLVSNQGSQPVGDGPDMPSAEDRLESVKMKDYRLIEDKGDGFKSYIAICLTLLLGRRPVVLIDEPNMCLHPLLCERLLNFNRGKAQDSPVIQVAMPQDIHRVNVCQVRRRKSRTRTL